ncbi:MAG: aminotransferase class III-fold pyridoxal phosphate-dependent enzyme [Oscillospiraceae bacterium]|nr:aminotransferase class III-fold pyridoxal phosphate-dependent enzyme [Oscillospiraceae bacterium]
MTIQEKDKTYIAGTYKRFPVTIVSGKGSVVADENGKEYIDMGTGIAVNSFGVADELWQRAVTAQLGKVQHMSNLYYTEPCALLAEQLCTRTGMARVFFSNSGAEANECAIKAARKWASEHKGPEYSTIITLDNSFHGRTLTTLAATGQAHFHELFQPLTPGFVHAAPGNAAELLALTKQHRAAAVMIECIQGEGGVLPLDPAYAGALAEIVKEQNLLLIVDEVQTGNGRTGQLYSYMNYGLTPDIVSTAKGLAGGLPLGATLLGERLRDVFSYGDHGSTFGGNPVCCAAALSVLSRLDEALLAEVREKGEYLVKTFEGAPGIVSVSGMGLMLGLETVKPAAEVVSEAMERGVLCLTAKNKLRLLPALNIPWEALEKAAGIIRDCCANK